MAGRDGTTQPGPFSTKSPYTSLRDMFDGGGAGTSGDTFEGGGLLSYFANMLGTPLGSQQMNGQTPGIRPPQNIPAMSTRGYAAPVSAPQAPQQPPMQYSGRGDVGMPQPMQMPNLMDTMADARSGRAEDAFLRAGQPRPMQYGGRGSYGMPGPRQSMSLQDQKADEIRAYLAGLK